MDVLRRACCFCAPRTPVCSARFLETALKEAIAQAVADGFDVFYHGGRAGIDLIAAEQVLSVKHDGLKQIKLIGILPFEEQAKYWNNHWRERYYNLLEKCDDVHTLYTRYERGCYQESARYMIDRCKRMIAVYEGPLKGVTRSAVLYAQKREVEIKIIYPPK